MEEIGIVQGIEGVIAKVHVERKSVCDQCTEGKCKLTEGGALIEAFNRVKAQEGQKVRVVFKPYTYVRGSILIYGVPTLALIVGAVLGKEFLSRITALDPDLLSAIGGFGLFIIAFIGVKLMSNRMEKKTDFKPIVEAILE
jgi:sigma-E factor negative regulatory protein RseC